MTLELGNAQLDCIPASPKHLFYVVMEMVDERDDKSAGA